VRAGLSAVLALGVCLLPAGCSFGGDEVAQKVQQPALLSAASIGRLPAGSPERTLFEWWRAMQFDDVAAAAPRYASRASVTAARLDAQLSTAGRAFDPRPRLVEVDRRDGRATVSVLLELRTSNPNGRVDVTRSARAFALVLEGGRWRLADNRYLEGAVRQQRELARALRGREGSPP
jgi:hypothetical protein